MTDDLQMEVEAINSIYGPQTLTETDSQSRDYRLAPADLTVALMLSFPLSYPLEPPVLRGTESQGTILPKGHASDALRIARASLEKIFQPGSVCIYEFIEDLQESLREDSEVTELPDNENGTSPLHEPSPISVTLDWTLSEPLTERKSIFLARVTDVDSPSAVKAALNHLLDTDKKVAKATHNIFAYRIRDSSNPAVLYQDCDDDGESAAGGRLLKLLQNMDVFCLVVVSRWYGGVKLGPDRFRLINQAARLAIEAWREARATSR